MRYFLIATLAAATVACGNDSPAGRGTAAAAVPESGADVAVATNGAAAVTSADTVVVYKTPTCGCCSNWVDHVREAGFTVVTHDLNDLSGIKAQYGVPAAQASCHTARVGGYTIEGHVPADLIARLLTEKPSVRGLAVPGMPMGSPGMEGLVKQDYDVNAFDSEGRITVFAKR